MAGTIGDAFVNVVLDPKQVNSQLASLGGGLEGKFGALGKLGGKALGAGLIAGAAVAAVEVGKYLYGIGESFDDMSDTIAVQTGASGKELDGLVKVAKQVGTQVPASFEEVGNAVGQLHSRTGLTGKALGDMSKQMLELARTTGEDLSKSIETSTRLLGDWGLKGAKASEGLDTLFKASQETGVNVTQLGELMTKFGAPFRQFGFEFTESAATLGKWQREGVNTQLVAGGMRIALAKFAKAGKEPKQALQDVIAEIERLGPGAKATGLAMKTFGARAGADMAAAILEGRFAIDDLVTSIEKSDSTITGSAAKTNDFNEQWLMFKNQIAVAVAPVAEKLFAAIGDGMQYATEHLPEFIALLKTELGPTIAGIADILVALQPAFRVATQLAGLMVTEWVNRLGGLLKVVQGVVDVIAGILTGDWARVWKGAGQIVEGVVQVIRGQITLVLTVLKGALTAIGNAATALADAIVRGIVNGLKALPSTVAGLLTKLGGVLSSAGRSLAAQAVQIGVGIVTGIAGGLASLPSRVGAFLTALGGQIRGWAGSAFAYAFQIGSAIVSGVIAGMGNLLGAVKDKIVSGVKGAISAAGGILHGSGDYQITKHLIGKPLAEGIIEGFVIGVAPLGAKMADSLKTAIEAARTAVGNQREKFAGSWGDLVSDALTAFDAIKGQLKTKTEKLLDAMELDRRVAEMRDKIQAATAELGAARAEAAALSQREGESPEEFAARQAQAQAAVLAAQKTLDDALYEQRRAALEKKAAQERIDLDATIALQRRHLEQRLTNLQGSLAKEGATAGEAQAATLKVLNSFGVKMGKAGTALGDSFVTGFNERLRDAVNDAENIMDEILRRIAGLKAASAGLAAGGKGKSTGPQAQAAAAPRALAGPTGAAGGVAGPVPFGQTLRRALGGVAAAATQARPFTGEGLDVSVYIGDQELRGIVRTEVRQADQLTAFQIGAGARV